MQAMKRAEEFTGRLKQAFGEQLVSVVLYGSAARGDYREGVSDLNLMVILRDTDPATLRLGTALAREWAAAGNPPPLMLSETEWHRSADVFPIEYEDMLDSHQLLHGEDPFAGVQVEWEHLRLQVEHELKSKQIQLRQQYLVLSAEPEGLGTLLTRALPTFLTLFRAGLHLAGQDAPRDPARTITAISQLVPFDPAPFEEVLRARGSGTPLKVAGDGSVVVGYMKGVQSTTRWLDRLERPRNDSDTA